MEIMEVKFNDFCREKQKELYLSDKEKYQSCAATSQFAEIRRLVLQDKDCKGDILDEIFNKEIDCILRSEETQINMRLLFEHPNTRNLRQKSEMLTEDMLSIGARKFIAIESKDSTFLNQYLIELLQERDVLVKEEKICEIILNNKYFKLDEGTAMILFNNEETKVRVNTVELLSAKEHLNILITLLGKEVSGYNDEKVIKAIIEKDGFECKESDILKILATEENYHFRQYAAKRIDDSYFLKKMILQELEDNSCTDVVDAIIDNPKFKFDDEVIVEFGKSDRLYLNLLCLRNSKDSRSLESEFRYQTELYRVRVRNQEDIKRRIRRIKAIKANKNFKLNKELLEREQKFRIFALLYDLKNDKDNDKDNDLEKCLEDIWNLLHQN